MSERAWEHSDGINLVSFLLFFLHGQHGHFLGSINSKNYEVRESVQKDDGKGGEGIEGKWKPDMEMEMDILSALETRRNIYLHLVKLTYDHLLR